MFCPLKIRNHKNYRLINSQEPWSEAHQERLELLRARVLELNRQLGALAAGWRHGQLSLHMNLALPAALLNGTPAVTNPSNAAVLRSQNRMLAEVSTTSLVDNYYILLLLKIYHSIYRTADTTTKIITRGWLRVIHICGRNFPRGLDLGEVKKLHGGFSACLI